MSSASKATQQLASETTTKKKFGKNLNKLTKPPEPSAASAPKQNSASRNGLLLLSTKRASSNNGAAASSGGILSNKSSQPSAKPLPVLGLQYESNTSTHDALLGAVVGASRAETEQPDAWGVADKKGTPEEGTERTEVETTKTSDVNSKFVETTTRNVEEDNSPPKESKDKDDANGPNWDEYGGRNLSPEKKAQGTLANTDDDYQVSYMTQRAKERSEQRRSEEEARMNLQKERANQRLKELEEKMSNGDTDDEQPRQRTLYDPNRPYNSSGKNGRENGSSDMELARRGRAMSAASDDSRDMKVNQQPMIKLSSYDDRDRGTSSGPRMLFDPKSGSMVAVSSREDSNKGRGRKERKKGRNGRDKDSKAESRADNDGSKATRKGKSRKDDATNQQTAPSDSRRGRNNCSKRLPRTCGVLYKRDNKGHYVCADGADGDLGYGAHSVPGGKSRNADAYARVMKEKKRAAEESKNADKHNDSQRDDPSSPEASPAPEVALQTGLTTGETESLHDWVLPNEKISLVTGHEDSPTLQATAKAWAPSEAALSAAAKAAAERSVNVSASVESKEEEVGDEDDDDVPLGLGFDPTLHMDSMMQSPAAEPADNLDPVDFAALSLEPAMQTTAQNTHSIFAFESGSTWGTGNTGGHSDWGMPSSGGNLFSSNDSGGGPAVTTSFLSLATSNTWGNALTGSPLGGSALNEHAGQTTTGD
mmetsp:Transcript_18446/g.45725  ORF Transcript_18446/g.45725 Transcript_18446/m.45725 type:complete len:707 (+) Transcript_18446:363-2483(+)|eukprot:CAMPEP_0113623342 /NCGR_PEP_ID=MMETSP0017_2-20120614/12002_1 /TAXON_ID=2856 /ORGANISM="Cylindrotheca closterium" /LENGTH=706 /DNA_ID=CAMNT_0000533277 /DNA_START=293 /DNA_END=2413 /DNA_ORIENTATION=- /assembly_acc=CAM_ASM_000147